MSAARRPDWTERKAAVLAAADLRSIAESAGATLNRTGSEYKGDCPVCGGGAFTIYADGARWHCFSACDKGGNVIDLVMAVDGIAYLAALEKLEAMSGIGTDAWSPEHRAEVARRAAARQANAARARLADKARGLLRAGKTWDEARPLRSTDCAFRYLADRGLDMPRLAARLAPDTLRFHAGLGHIAELDRETLTYPRTWPALVARLVDARGELAAVQAIWIDPATQATPPEVEAATGRARRIWRPAMKPPKRALGLWSGACCRLFAPVAGAPLAVAEGIEKSLAYTQLYDVPCWAAMFAANFDELAETLIAAAKTEAGPSEIVYAVDVNRPMVNKRTGVVTAPDGLSIEMARRGAEKLRAAGVPVRIVKPAAGSDWSDMLVAHLAARRQAVPA